MAYAVLNDVKDRFNIADADTTDDDEITDALNAAEQAVSQFCNRNFTATTGSPTAMVFRPTPSQDLVFVPDFGTLTGLVVKTDTTGDGTYDTTLAITTDFVPEPHNASAQIVAKVWTRIHRVGGSFPSISNRPTVQVTADWGWLTAPPTAVKEATIIQAVALYSAGKAPLGYQGYGDTGIFRLKAGLHPTAEALLKPFVRYPVGRY